MANIYKLEGRAYEIDCELNELEALIAENDGEMTPEIEDRYEKLHQEEAEIVADIAKKPEHYMRWYKNTKAELETFKKAKDEIEKKRKSADRRLSFIQDLLTEAMVANDKKEMKEEGGLFKATLRSSESTKYDEATVLKPYKVVIDTLTSNLPSYIEVETKIKVSGFEKGAVLPEGFYKESNVKAQIR